MFMMWIIRRILFAFKSKNFKFLYAITVYMQTRFFCMYVVSVVRFVAFMASFQ